MAVLTDKFLKSVGGKKIAHGNSRTKIWNFGWIPPVARTDIQQAAHHRAVAEMPRFAIKGKSLSENSDVTQALLYDLWKTPHVVAANGYAYPGIHQLTGSCVGCGGGNAIFTLACVEAITRGDAELALIPFWPLPYGRSRYYLGDRSPGEGSSGSTFAKAAKEDGVVEAKRTGLPPWEHSDGLVWGSRVEMSWSDGDASQTMALLPESRKHPIKTTAACADANDVREAIVNGFPCTAASMYAHDGGRVQGSPPILLARKSGSWSHQMSIQAWLKHPQFGELFYLMNQWGLDAHGQDPFGGPPGGVWITASDVSWICRDEVYAFSQFDGFPAPPIDRIPWTF